VPTVSASLFRLVCVAAALDGAPAGWAAEMLVDGDVALAPDDTGLAGIDAVAHALGVAAIPVLRSEPTPAQRDATVIEHAGALPLVWLAPQFSDPVRTWAQERGPMTLLVQADGPLSDEERRRIERFVALLGRQAE
jgi:hypothetical protein